MKIVLWPIIFLVFFACKTREQIEQENLVKNLNVVVKDQYKLSSDATSRIGALEENVSKIRGMVEDQSHKTRKELEEKIGKLEERVALLEGEREEINLHLKEQGEYLQTITTTLKKKG